MTFFANDAPIPAALRSDAFVLRPLRAADVDLDYEAVMAAQEALRRDNGGRWPRPDFTLEENLTDLQGHEADFHARRGFTYTVLDPTERRCLGCVYVYPTADEHGTSRPKRFSPVSTCSHSRADANGGGDARDEAEVRFWVRQDGVIADFDRHLLAALLPWLREDFPFTRVRSPAWGSDERRTTILSEAGLRLVAAHPVGDTEYLLFA